MEVNFFPQELIDLQQEIAKSPPAQEHMAKCASPYLEDRIAHLCIYLGVIVDDDFEIDELCELAEMCTRKLYEMRTGIAVTH